VAAAFGFGERDGSEIGSDSGVELKQPRRSLTSALLGKNTDHPADAGFAIGRRCLRLIAAVRLGLGRTVGAFGVRCGFTRRLLAATGRSWLRLRAAHRWCRNGRLRSGFGFRAAGLLLRRFRAGLSRLDQRADVFGRFDAIRFGPGQLFFDCEAATVPFPALFGSETPTWTGLAGVRDTIIRLLATRRGQREPEREHQVTDQGQHHNDITQAKTMRYPEPTTHT